MPPPDFLVIDIETVPVVPTSPDMTEEERKKKINPIDSRVVAVGLLSGSHENIFCSDNEAEILTKTWEAIRAFKQFSPAGPIVGFNHASFDMPFLVTRSFLLDVPIHHFTVNRDLVDIRDKLKAYAYGEQRGKLKELAALTGLEILDVDGSDVERLWREDREKLCEYLRKDLALTRALYERAARLNITKISRF